MLVVDATQGVEAQTVANAMLAMNANLDIIPLINKIDLTAAEPDRVREEIEEGLAIPADDAVLASGKTGEGVHDLLEAVVYNIPAPVGDADAPLRALIFDSYFDPYRGVVALVRVVDGAVKKGDRVLMMATGTEVLVEEVGARRPAETPLPELSVGEVGYLVTGLKDVRQVKVGDTITAVRGGVDEPLPGYRDAKPMVYTGLFPLDGDQYEPLKEALEKLSLNDPALAVGARDLARPRLRLPRGLSGPAAHGGHQGAPRARVRPRPSGHGAIAWSTTCTARAARWSRCTRPRRCPTPARSIASRSPISRRRSSSRPTTWAPSWTWPRARRGTFVTMNYPSPRPPSRCSGRSRLSELILDYLRQAEVEHEGLRLPRLRHRRLQALAAREAGHPAFGQAHRRAVVHRAQGQGLRPRARADGDKLKEIIPRQMFEVPIQAAIGGRVLARQTVKAKRKDVLAKCYGGDITRKRKLLEKQKAGKKRMKAIGNVEVPQEAFMAILKVDE